MRLHSCLYEVLEIIHMLRAAIFLIALRIKHALNRCSSFYLFASHNQALDRAETP